MANILLDGAVSALMTLLARWLADPAGGLFHPLWFLAGGGLTLLASGLPFRIPQQYWRYSGVIDLRNIIAASLLSALLFALLLWGTGYGLPTPTFPFIDALMLVMGLGGVRLATRLITSRARHHAEGEREAVLLVGAEPQLDLLIRFLQEGRSCRSIVGLVVPKALSQGQRIHGHAILGAMSDINAILARLETEGRLPTQMILADPDIRGTALMALLSDSADYGVPVFRMPAWDHFHPADQMELQPIVLEDLLNRAPIHLSATMEDAMGRLIAGQTILVTGAGGSIGAELVHQIAAFQPKALILLEHSEYALWKVSLAVSEHYPNLHYHQVLSDVQQRDAMRRLFERYRPDLVFHAAALKHVPLVEKNPCEAIQTNAIGTRIVADCACNYGAKALVMISTDKAVYPSNVMGATKRCAEIYTHALDQHIQQQGGKTRCLSVRFGNVLGSTGSVVPLFQHQLARGGPLTITDPDMTRYFMTISEAVGLVLQATQRRLDTAMGSLFVLDMGKPVRIMELARQMIRLVGLRPDHDIAIAVTGRREGEKLAETLFYEEERAHAKEHEGLWEVPSVPVPLERVSLLFEQLEQACFEGKTEPALDIVRQLVPEFSYGGLSKKGSPHQSDAVS